MRRNDPRAQQLLCAKNRVRTYAYTVAWRGPSFVIQAAREAAPTATDEVLLWHVRRVGHSDEYGRTRFAVPGQSFGRAAAVYTPITTHSAHLRVLRSWQTYSVVVRPHTISINFPAVSSSSSRSSRRNRNRNVTL